MINKISGTFLALLSVLAVGQASADPIIYTDRDAFLGALASPATVASFETLSPGTVVDQQIAGFNFNPWNSGGAVVASVFPDSPASGSNLINVSAGGRGFGGGGFSVVFDQPATAFGLLVGGLNFGGTLLSVDGGPIFDLWSDGSGSNPNGVDFFGITSTVSFSSITVSVSSSDYVWFDNIQVGTVGSSTTAVPAPQTALLLGLGVLGLAARRRRLS